MSKCKDHTIKTSTGICVDCGWQEPTPTTPTKDIEEQIIEISDKYGYWLGLAYEDENGNLAQHQKGEVAKRLAEFVKSAQTQSQLELLDRLPRKHPIVQGWEEYHKGYNQALDDVRSALQAEKGKGDE